jgi:hypothetical protein
MKQFFTTKEAAEYLDLSIASIKYHTHKTKKLRGEKYGHTLLFTRETLDVFKATPRPVGRPPKIADDK